MKGLLVLLLLLLIVVGLLSWIESACEEDITIEEILSFDCHDLWRLIVMEEEVYSAQH
jgi:hypothetical protein